jgi:chromatin structure-remodeling complex subunit RSC3/30
MWKNMLSECFHPFHSFHRFALRINLVISLLIQESDRRVLKRARHLRAQLPAFLQWDPESVKPEHATLHLEFLHQDFLIYSTLVKRTGKGHDALIKISLEIITCLLDVVSRQMRTFKTQMLTVHTVLDVSLLLLCRLLSNAD